MAKKEDHNLRGIGLLVLGVVGVLAVVSLILLFSQASSTGKSFADEPFEETFAAGNIEWPVATKTPIWECYLPINNVGGTGKADGRFQKPQCAFEDGAKVWWESKGWSCVEATSKDYCVVNFGARE